MRTRGVFVVVLVSIVAGVGLPAGTVGSATAACQTAAASPRLDLFARGTDNALWHRWWVQGSPWTCGQTLGGDLTSAAAVASDIDDVLHVIARGPDNRMKHKWFLRDGDNYTKGWTNWETFGSEQFTSAPAAASWSTTHLEFFARGTDNRIWHNWYRFGSGWSGWYALDGGGFTSAPAAVAYAPERLHEFARGADNRIWGGTIWAAGNGALGNRWATNGSPPHPRAPPGASDDRPP